NRGMCAQPCRKKYTLVEAAVDRYGRPTGQRDVPLPDQYLLSPKDLCTYREIPRLADATVASLKIEGRMKSPEYVAIVVSTYRRALDAAARGSFVPDGPAVRDLMLAFNRGFTRGYLFGDRGGKLMARDRPDNRGVCIGTVSRYDRPKGTATVRPVEPVTLHPGDGLLFSHPDHPSAALGYALNSEPVVKKEGIVLAVPHPVQEGARVFLTASVDLAARARQISRQGMPGLHHPVPADIVAAVSPDGLLTLAGTLYPPGKDPVAVKKAGDLCLVPARSRPLTREQLAAQLEKTGGTPFAVAHLTLDYAGGLFSPASEINRARREFFARAEEGLVAASRPASEDLMAAQQRLAGFIAQYPATGPSPSSKTLPSPGRTMGICLYADSLESVEAGARAGAQTICFEPCGFPDPDEADPEAETSRRVSECQIALDTCRAHNARLVWKLPRITRQAEIEAVRSLLPRLHAAGLGMCMVENPGTAVAVVSAAPGLDLAGSWGLNIFNAETVRVLARLPFGILTLSPELSATGIAVLVRAARLTGPRPELAVFVQGNLDAMVTEDCLLSVSGQCRKGTGPCSTGRWHGIRDETGRTFPVSTDGACRTRILNASESCLVDAVPDLLRNRVDMIVIDARGRPAAYAEGMVRIYREAVGIATRHPGSTARDYAALKDRIKAMALGGITAGHYARGLKDE
ncbi:DUF3656 domain-containing U32 family peptidase, partial [Methanoregula sp.]|uniref:DUF3656 domain-containing U32 family peptidase n=1 Tax=Methanoregula sp. TaxID=2052170 RepID=UPI003BB02A36